MSFSLFFLIIEMSSTTLSSSSSEEFLDTCVQMHTSSSVYSNVIMSIQNVLYESFWASFSTEISTLESISKDSIAEMNGTDIKHLGTVIHYKSRDYNFRYFFCTFHFSFFVKLPYLDSFTLIPNISIMAKNFS